MSIDITNVHPGYVLQEYLDDYKLSQSALARELRVPVRRINAIIKGQRGITADTALRLSRYFGTSVEYWLRLQQMYDVRQTEKQISADLDCIHPIAAA